jgi:hypothetical protein
VNKIALIIPGVGNTQVAQDLRDAKMKHHQKRNSIGLKSVTITPDCQDVQVNRTALLTPVVGNTQVAQGLGDVKMKMNPSRILKRGGSP